MSNRKPDTLHLLQDPIIWFLIALGIFFGVHKGYPPYRINDTAVEVLQIRAFSPWPFQVLVGTYPGGNVDFIESFYAYLMQPVIYLFGDGVEAFQLCMGFMFATAIALFFCVVRHLTRNWLAHLSTALYAGSAYAIWQHMLLTRSGFVPVMLLGQILGFVQIVDGSGIRGSLLIAISCFLAAFTYSSFKAILPAFAIAGIVAIFLGKLDDKRTKITAFIVAGIGSIVAIVTCIWASDTSMYFFLRRGSYMMDMSDLGKDPSVSVYLRFLLRSLLLPIWQTPEGFVVDPTHSIFGRGMLNFISALPWIVGIGSVLVRAHRREYFAIFLSMLWLVGSALMCLSGPSLKSHFIMWPIVALIMSYGLEVIFARVKGLPRSRTLAWLTVLTAIVIDFNHLRYEMMERVESWPESAGEDLSRFLEAHDGEFDKVIYTTHFGLENSRLYHRNWLGKDEHVFEVLGFEASYKEAVGTSNRVWTLVPLNSAFSSVARGSYGGCFTEETLRFSQVPYLLIKPCSSPFTN